MVVVIYVFLLFLCLRGVREYLRGLGVVVGVFFFILQVGEIKKGGGVYFGCVKSKDQKGYCDDIFV